MIKKFSFIFDKHHRVVLMYHNLKLWSFTLLTDGQYPCGALWAPLNFHILLIAMHVRSRGYIILLPDSHRVELNLFIERDAATVPTNKRCLTAPFRGLHSVIEFLIS
jgi:hypothetical protein